MKIGFNNDIWNLLKRNLSKGQLLGYIISNIVGLSIILSGIMFYCDSRSTDDEDSFFSKDYIVISKKVEGIGFNSASFSEEEIDNLQAQDWVKRIGKFTSSQFAVNGSVEMGGRGLSTYLFFESVPDEFFDIKPRDWDFNENKKFIPIILNKDYLALYNFGFAVPQGLPQVSEDIISAIPIHLRLIGSNSFPESFDAAIVGFSSRLNTIAVPQSFMDWANERYGPGQALTLPPSRLIVEIDRLKSASMTKYLESENLEVAGDKADSGKISDFLSVASSIVTLNGIVISLLAFFILILSIFLLLQKSKEKLRFLMLLGYPPGEVGIYYEAMIVICNFCVMAVSVSVSLLVRGLWNSKLQELGLGGASVLPLVLTAIMYFIIVSLINIQVIRYRLRKIWSNR